MSNNELENKWIAIGLVQKLKSKNQVIYDYVLRNCISACSYLDIINDFFDEYTDHTSTHSLAVLKNGDELIKGITLNEVELAIFILSCYFHDIGMNVTKDKIEKYTNEPDFALEREYLIDKISARNELDSNKVTELILNKFILLEYIRERHHKFSSEWIINEYNAENINAYIEIDYCKYNIWTYVAKVSEAHCWNLKEINNQDLGNVYVGGIRVNLMFLACLLRMADYCHMGRDRALPFVRTAKDFYSKKSKRIWEKLGTVNYVAFNPDKKSIEFSAECDDYDIHRALVKEAENIDEELHSQIKHLAKHKNNYQYNYFYVDASHIKERENAGYVYSPARFTMNYNKITELLIGSKLYAENLYALREVVQNAKDAVSVYALNNKFLKPYILINCCGDNQNIKAIEIFDNGVGMDTDIFSKHFLSIGENSFWVTKMCFNEFGNTKELTSIIASHGIGVLSYFLIANEIQVFSKYKDAQAIHVRIDNYNENVVFIKTHENNFPKFNQELCEIQTPWQSGHGTCIKLMINKKLSTYDMINFISQHILRIGCDLYITLNNVEVVKIPENWIPPSEEEVLRRREFANYGDMFSYRNLDDNIFSPEQSQEFVKSIIDTGVPFGVLIKEMEDRNFLKHSYINFPIPDNELKDEYTLKEYVKKTYDVNKNRNPYGPKEPISIDLNIVDVRGKVYFENDGNKQIHNRLSQNGIWVKNGNIFLDKSISEILGAGNDIFSYDIDITKSYRFDLNASRDEIVNNTYNHDIARKLVKILIENVSKLINEINYIVAFPCGNHWYHGIDLLFSKEISDSPFEILYQKTFNQLWKICFSGRLEEQLSENILKSILQAKIYHAFSMNENQTYSLEDISQSIDQFRVLIPTYVNSDENINGIEQRDYNFDKKAGQKSLDKCVLIREKAVVNYVKRSDKKIIIMPKYLQSFMEPLLSRLTWKIEIQEGEFTIFYFDNCTTTIDTKKKNIQLIKKAIRFVNKK